MIPPTCLGRWLTDTKREDEEKIEREERREREREI